MSFRLSIDCFKKDQRLKKVFDTDQKITEIEKKIFQKSANDPQKYRNIIYDIITDILKGQNFKDVLRSLEQEKFVWNHPEFSEIIFKQREQDEFIVNPFEVEEGVLTCPKCSKSRTFSYSKQTRSADEPMTTFATCMNCRYKWTYSG